MIKKTVKKPQPIQFTQAGYTEIEKKYELLKTQRAAAVNELTTASALGDRSENAAYKVARQKLNAVDRELRHLSFLIRYGIVVAPTTHNQVELGTQVTVQQNSTQKTYLIVGGYESDIHAGKISCFSPIGKALMGKKKGEIVEVITPNGKIQLHILSIT